MCITSIDNVSKVIFVVTKIEKLYAIFCVLESFSYFGAELLQTFFSSSRD